MTHQNLELSAEKHSDESNSDEYPKHCMAITNSWLGVNHKVTSQGREKFEDQISSLELENSF